MNESTQTGPKRLAPPLTEEAVLDLKEGEEVIIEGSVYAIKESLCPAASMALQHGQELPFKAEGQIVLLIGPTPPEPPRTVGVGAQRFPLPLDILFKQGIRAVIGVGFHGDSLNDLLKEYPAVCLSVDQDKASAVGAAIKSISGVAAEAEAIRGFHIFTVENFPARIVRAGL